MNTKLVNTEIIQLNIDAPESDRIERAANILRSGGLVAFPTETVYGLGANALDAAAVARIFEAKGRPAQNPVIVHVADVTAAGALVTEWPETAARLAETFWPGPLTLVLPKRELVPDIVTAGGPTVALRVPSHPVALALLKAAGVPVAAPSANRSMQVSPTTTGHVAKSLSGRIEMILDGGPTTGGIESTVLSLAGKRPTLLRPGLVSPADIEAVIGPIQRLQGNLGGRDGKSRPLPSPGLMSRHYAPRAVMEIAVKGAERVEELLGQDKKVGWLTFAALPERSKTSPRLSRIKMPQEPTAYAARLYAALHELDSFQVSHIVVDALPDGEEWLALRDRVQRASTKEQNEPLSSSAGSKEGMPVNADTSGDDAFKAV